MGKQIIVSRDDAPGVKDEGAVTAIVQLLGSMNEPKGYYLMSCLHVFGLTNSVGFNYDTPTNICFEDDIEKVVATYDGSIRGELFSIDKGLLSFDAALAKIKIPSSEPSAKDYVKKLKAKLPAPGLKDYIFYPENTPKQGKVMTSRGAISAREFKVFRGTDKAVSYKVTDSADLRTYHRVIIEYEANTLPGDSGCPVVDDSERVLLGMHIAGGNGKGYMIPAIDLIDRPTRFSGREFNKNFTIVFV